MIYINIITKTMLPPKCFSCGKFLADIEIEYETKKNDIDANTSLSIEEKKQQKKELLNKMYIKRWCCRSQVITYTDLINIII
jgi:DNA-directed RNA polymerase subunit N (RpoN/RPB10)